MKQKKDNLYRGKERGEGKPAFKPQPSSHSEKPGGNSHWKHPGGKLLARGAESLTDAELLAILLGTGIKGKPAERLATEILSKYGTLEQALLHLSSERRFFYHQIEPVNFAGMLQSLQKLWK